MATKKDSQQDEPRRFALLEQEWRGLKRWLPCLRRKRVVQIARTCDACPSLWEGRFSDGDHLYARYRWGHLAIRKSPTDQPYTEESEVLLEAYGDEAFDGWMTDVEFIRVSRRVLRLPADWAAGAADRDREREEAFRRGLEQLPQTLAELAAARKARKESDDEQEERNPGADC